MSTRQQVNAWTDGASSGNPGPSGWAVLIEGKLFSDWFANATNNFAEMFAAYQAVDHCPCNRDLVIHTDSKLVIGWLSQGWKMEHEHIRGIASAIFDVAQLKGVALRFEKVKGHASDDGNIRVDKAAQMQARIAKNVLAT